MSATAAVVGPLPPPERILRLPEVSTRTGLSRSAIYRRIAKREFPAQVDLGGGVVGWHESKIAEWIANRPSVGTH